MDFFALLHTRELEQKKQQILKNQIETKPQPKKVVNPTSQISDENLDKDDLNNSFEFDNESQDAQPDLKSLKKHYNELGKEIDKKVKDKDLEPKKPKAV